MSLSKLLLPVITLLLLSAESSGNITLANTYDQALFIPFDGTLPKNVKNLLNTNIMVQGWKISEKEYEMGGVIPVPSAGVVLHIVNPKKKEKDNFRYYMEVVTPRIPFRLFYNHMKNEKGEDGEEMSLIPFYESQFFSRFSKGIDQVEEMLNTNPWSPDNLAKLETLTRGPKFMSFTNHGRLSTKIATFNTSLHDEIWLEAKVKMTEYSPTMITSEDVGKNLSKIFELHIMKTFVFLEHLVKDDPELKNMLDNCRLKSENVINQCMAKLESINLNTDALGADNTEIATALKAYLSDPNTSQTFMRALEELKMYLDNQMGLGANLFTAARHILPEESEDLSTKLDHYVTQFKLMEPTEESFVEFVTIINEKLLNILFNKHNKAWKNGIVAKKLSEHLIKFNKDILVIMQPFFDRIIAKKVIDISILDHQKVLNLLMDASAKEHCPFYICLKMLLGEVSTVAAKAFFTKNQQIITELFTEEKKHILLDYVYRLNLKERKELGIEQPLNLTFFVMNEERLLI